VVGAVAGDDLVASGIEPGDLHGVLVGLGSTQREEALGEPGDLGQLFTQLAARLGGEGGSGEAELVYLFLDSLEHLRVLVPDVDVDELRAEVQPLVALTIPKPHPLGLGHVDGVGLALHRPGEKGVVAVLLDDFRRGAFH